MCNVQYATPDRPPALRSRGSWERKAAKGAGHAHIFGRFHALKEADRLGPRGGQEPRFGPSPEGEAEAVG
jgi:hypothetical protein